MKPKYLGFSVVCSTVIALSTTTGSWAQEQRIITNQQTKGEQASGSTTQVESKTVYNNALPDQGTAPVDTKVVYAAGSKPSKAGAETTSSAGLIVYAKNYVAPPEEGASTNKPGVVVFGQNNSAGPDGGALSKTMLAPASTCQQYSAAVLSNSPPGCSFSSPGYAADASFTIVVTDAEGCAGTYTVNAAPVAGTAPNGGTPRLTTTTTYIGFPQGDFLFNRADPGQYKVTITNTSNSCSPGKNPVVLTVTVADGATSAACQVQNPNQFTATVSTNVAPSCSFASPGYAKNGSFTILVADGSCNGTYRVEAHPVAGSAPDGSTPPGTTTDTYIGFPEGSFLFNRAGVGQYTVTVTNTGGDCGQGRNPVVLTVTVTDGATSAACQVQNPNQFTATVSTNVAPSCSFASPGYAKNGSFTILVADGSCNGTYRVEAHPVAGSAPDGSTPPGTTTDTYIGFPEGSFLFNRAGVGQYTVTVTNTGGDCGQGRNPVVLTVTVTDGATSAACQVQNPNQFTATVSTNVAPSCSFASPGYAKNGSFTILVADGSCNGTYRVEAHPVAGSAPDGSTPPGTTTDTYIGFPEGSFLFNRAGVGQYTVTVTNTGGDCGQGRNPVVLTVTVTDGATSAACQVQNPNQFTATVSTNVAPSCSFASPGYAKNGSFTILVADGSCNGTYRVEAHPVAGSAPDGSTPPGTTTDTYIGFPEGSFLFNRAGVGQYTVTVTNTGGDCGQGRNPVVLTVTVTDGTTPTMNAVSDVKVCPGEMTPLIAFSSASTGVVYHWTNDNPAIGLPASGVGPISPFRAINSGATPAVATITVTPAFDNSGCLCQGTPVQFKITVADDQPPVISDVHATPDVLTPPNHKMQKVTVNYTVTDLGPVTSVLSVTSNEPVSGTGGGDKAPDWEVVDAHHVNLRAERLGSGFGRIYTVTITSTDECGHSSTASVPVLVPKGNGDDHGKPFVVQAAVVPNPTRNSFTLTISNADPNEAIGLQVADVSGRIVDVLQMKSDGTLNFGAAYRKGVYFLYVSQGEVRYVLKLIKTND